MKLASKNEEISFRSIFFFSKNSAKKIYVLKEAPEFLKMWVKQSFVNSEK